MRKANKISIGLLLNTVLVAALWVFAPVTFAGSEVHHKIHPHKQNIVKAYKHHHKKHYGYPYYKRFHLYQGLQFIHDPYIDRKKHKRYKKHRHYRKYHHHHHILGGHYHGGYRKHHRHQH